MPQDQCQCQSGTHGHEPGECKNAVTHEEDRMCDYCHDLAAEDLVATLPPENELPLGRGLLVTPATWGVGFGRRS